MTFLFSYLDFFFFLKKNIFKYIAITRKLNFIFREVQKGGYHSTLIRKCLSFLSWAWDVCHNVRFTVAVDLKKKIFKHDMAQIIINKRLMSFKRKNSGCSFSVFKKLLGIATEFVWKKVVMVRWQVGLQQRRNSEGLCVIVLAMFYIFFVLPGMRLPMWHIKKVGVQVADWLDIWCMPPPTPSAKRRGENNKKCQVAGPVVDRKKRKDNVS